MKVTRKLSTRLLMANLLVLAAGGGAFAVSFRLLASEIFDRRVRGGGQGGPGGGPGQGLLVAFNESVDIALLVSLAVGVIVAALVAWFVSDRMTAPIDRIRDATRAIASGDYSRRVEASDIVELEALAEDVNSLASQLDETEQRRAMFLSDVAHELRTPLASITGFVEGTVDGVFTPEEMHEAVAAETARLLRLIEDLSVLSRTAEGSLEMASDPVDLAAVAEEAADQLRPQFAERGAPLAVDAKAAPIVLGDAHRIRQVLTNLVVNALGHVDAGGRVVITVDESGPVGIVKVTDDGDGIRPEDLDRVFDRFFRGGDAKKRSGSGLGLSVASGIASAHGGSLVATSDGLGTGATFTLAIPLR